MDEPVQVHITVSDLEAELARESYKQRYYRTLRSTIFSLVVVAAIAVLLVTIWMPVLHIFGTSMSPTLQEGDYILCWKTGQFEPGEIISLYLGNKVLVKRYIAGPGQWVDIDMDGNVFVDGQLLEEPYADQKMLGDCNIHLPYQVPENHYFVLGDHRSISQDSRNSAVGCIAKEDVVGKIVFRIWPISRLGGVK